MLTRTNAEIETEIARTDVPTVFLEAVLSTLRKSEARMSISRNEYILCQTAVYYGVGAVDCTYQIIDNRIIKTN